MTDKEKNMEYLLASMKDSKLFKLDFDKFLKSCEVRPFSQCERGNFYEGSVDFYDRALELSGAEELLEDCSFVLLKDGKAVAASVFGPEDRYIRLTDSFGAEEGLRLFCIRESLKALMELPVVGVVSIEDELAEKYLEGAYALENFQDMKLITTLMEEYDKIDEENLFYDNSL